MQHAMRDEIAGDRLASAELLLQQALDWHKLTQKAGAHDYASVRAVRRQGNKLWTDIELHLSRAASYDVRRPRPLPPAGEQSGSQDYAPHLQRPIGGLRQHPEDHRHPLDYANLMNPDVPSGGAGELPDYDTPEELPNERTQSDDKPDNPDEDDEDGDKTDARAGAHPSTHHSRSSKPTKRK